MRVPSVWVESLGVRFDHAVDLVQAVIRDCSDDLWEASMWDVPYEGARVVLGPGGDVVADPEERHVLIQREATPWGVARHALERLDFLLTGGFVPWQTWPPLAERIARGTAAAHALAAGVTGHTALDIPTLSVPWTRYDLLAYLDYCRGRITETLGALTDDRAATVVGSKAYATRLMQTEDHVVEHAAQVRQFMAAAQRHQRA